MILSDIKAYLQQRQQASLEDIALHFDSSVEAVRGMLDIWLRKGRVEHCLANDICGISCRQCESPSMQIYRWKGGESSLATIPLRMCD